MLRSDSTSDKCFEVIKVTGQGSGSVGASMKNMTPTDQVCKLMTKYLQLHRWHHLTNRKSHLYLTTLAGCGQILS